MNDFNRWRTLVAIIILLFLFEYSPMVIPSGQYHPMLVGVPYSLWLGMLGAALGVFLTYLAAKAHRKAFGKDKD